MPNPYRFKHNIDLIKKQLEDGTQNIYNRLQNNIDLDFTGIINSIAIGIKEAILGLGVPSFKNRQAKKLPSANDYNKNVKEICNDINNSYKQLGSIINIIKNNFNYNSLTNQTLQNEILILKDEADKINLYIQGTENNDFIINERFNNMINIIRLESDAHINNINGAVSLRRLDSYNHANENADISILGKSEGFVGTSHQVKASGNRREKWEENQASRTIVWYGEEDPHLDLKAVQDNNPDTWFEYELVNVPESAKKFAEYYGFHYKTAEGETIDWAKDPNNGKLELTVRIILPETETINWIDINPYIPPFEGSSNIIIKSIKTAPNKEEVPKSIYNMEFLNYRLFDNAENESSRFVNNDIIPGNNDLTGHGVFSFSPKKAQIIDITFEQDSSYNCLIGHVYYIRTVRVKREEESWFGLVKDTSYYTRQYRIEGPINQYDKTIIEKNNKNFLEELWDAIWGETTEEISSDNLTKWVEAFEGWRYSIGIRDININSFTYSEKSQVISSSYFIPGSIKKIEIETQEQIPEIFYSGESPQTSYENKGQWIKYYISLDNGNEWYSIAPNDDQISDIPSTIYVNSDIPVEKYEDTASYIKAENSNQIKVKAVLSRPTDFPEAELFTPVLNEYTLRLSVDFNEGENL